MNKLFKYLCLIIFFCVSFTVKSQFLCDYEYRILNKEKRKVRKKCVRFAKEWVNQHRDSLHIPEKVELSKFKFEPKPDEYEKGEFNPFNQWDSVDSLLCINERKQNVGKAKEELKKLNLTVYQINITFVPTNAENPEIASTLFFQYGIEGKTLRVVLRIKTMSKTSEIFFH